MRPHLIEILLVGSQGVHEMGLVEDDDPVKALFAHPTFSLILQPELHERREPVEDFRLVAVARANGGHAFCASPVPPVQAEGRP